MFIDAFHKIHCVGIGGIGISAIAKFLLAKGKVVTGSDAFASNITRELETRGIKVAIGQAAEHLSADVDLVVYTEAAQVDNVERAEAARRGIKQLGHFDFLGELSKEYRTICVTGTNGKSTTTAMTGLVFAAAGLDPTVFVGSLVPGWADGNLRLGQSDILIVEGDEYKRKMLKLHPDTTLITNIELDHLDVYKDLADIEAAFKTLCLQTKRQVFLNVFEHERGIYVGEGEAKEEYFGLEFIGKPKLPWFWKPTKRDRVIGDGKQSLQGLELQVPGEFNMMNALGARSIARAYGIDDAVIAQALFDFKGIWRRFEVVGEYAGATIISDYGHHPTAIRGTLAAAKEFYPGRRLVVLFEPHQHSRTKELFADFVTAFKLADKVILSEIYHVEGRVASEGEVSSLDLVKAINLDSVTYAPNLGEAEAQLRSVIQPGDVVVIMGAGDVDKVARNLCVKP
ncbi:MAG: UDP-N-acetylmuramate--L-alanine ligase [Patescibacteria group bacterium]